MAKPFLRFKEFRKVDNEWVSTLINDCVTFSKGGALSKSDLDVNGDMPCILYGDLYTKYGEVTKLVQNKTNKSEGLTISKSGDVLLPMSGETAEDIAKATCLLKDGVAYGGDLLILRSNSFYGPFLSYSLNSANRRKISKIAQGKSVVHINAKEISKLDINVPSYEEQQKIAEFFTALDEKIRIEEQRLRIFKKQASAVISGIFNRNSDLNEVTGKFNTHHLGSLVEEVKLLNKNKECDLVITNSAEFGIVPQKDFFDRNIAQEVNVNKYTIVENGDFVYNPRISKTAPAGPISRSHLNQGVVSPLYTVFRVNSDLVIGDYLECYFASGRWVAYAKSVANYGARHDRMNITNDDFFNMPIPVPDLKDQANISGLYKTLILKSKLQESKLSCLIKLKKAFMQRMFV